MAKQTIDLLIEGGKATPGPPLGPTLAPMGINIPKIVSDINEKTKDFKGMKVPVKVIVDTATKEFEIEVGLPPTSQLLLKESNIEKGSGTAEAGDIALDKVVKVAKIKAEHSLSKDFKNVVKEVLGSCVSIGLTVDGTDPKTIQKQIDKGTVKIE
jgi:large subunit ribosomal protein L11